MVSILDTHEDPRVASRELVRAAHQAGGAENVTVMVVGIPRHGDSRNLDPVGSLQELHAVSSTHPPHAGRQLVHRQR